MGLDAVWAGLTLNGEKWAPTIALARFWLGKCDRRIQSRPESGSRSHIVTPLMQLPHFLSIPFIMFLMSWYQ
ncbi:hypothetical protein L6164_004429 [Bauhinia variegata]|uniref:Uncharacterized protein n=1 Tax=Bauhinia variegata TaxID=167791 RepID=A0ACB9Q6L0_BAUVA|nr:hypothetical protein L6164_004429 [Bauhinia variegata]